MATPSAVGQAAAERVDVPWLSYAVRAAVLAAFVWYLWAVPYAPHRHEPFGDADGDAAVRAINAGHPFHLLYQNGEHQAPTIKRLSEVYADYGLQIAAAFVAGGGRWLWGPSFRLQPSIGRDILMGLLVVTSAAMLAPGVPLLVGIAGVLSLRALFAWGPMTLGPPQHWGVAYVALVTAVFVGCVFKPWTVSRACALTALAALAASSQLLRQESATVPTAVGLGLIATAGLILLAQRSTGADGSSARRLAQRAALGAVLLITANGAVEPIERWMFSRAWRTSYAETPAAAHGSGAPLYLSLGYVSNPFNLGWRDPIYQLHAQLIAPDLKYGDGEYQRRLLREYVGIVISRPWLLVENIAAKAARVHALSTRRAEKLPDVAVWQQPPHARFYKALPWLAVLCVALLWRRGTPEAAAICVTSIALAAAASAGALVIFPDYIGGVQGATVALALIVPAAVASSMIDRGAVPGPVATRLARRILTWSALLGVGAVLIGGIFIAIQWLRYRSMQDDIFKRDPLEAIAEQQFRYAHIFNDWPVVRQGRVVARLTSSNDSRVARAVDLRRGDLALFRPEVVVRTATQIHLIAWMGDTFHAPVPPLYQGTTHSLFFVCGECAPDSKANDFPSGIGFVNDLEWRGRYRMFSVPLNAKLETARFFHVAAERIVALDNRIEPTGLRTDPISSARIAYPVN
jgi:hypothetical protein